MAVVVLMAGVFFVLGGVAQADLPGSSGVGGTSYVNETGLQSVTDTISLTFDTGTITMSTTTFDNGRVSTSTSVSNNANDSSTSAGVGASSNGGWDV